MADLAKIKLRGVGFLVSGDYMPKGTKVEKIYTAIKKKTGDPGKAARIAQSVTGKSLATGKKPKGK